jgi:photosystem II stability/assembly factor-like uncharacterized protein
MIGTLAVACSNSNTGLRVSTNSGQTWSNPITSGNFSSVHGVYDSVNGIYRFVACVSADTGNLLAGGLYYCSASDLQTWTPSTSSGTTDTFFNAISMFEQYAIATSTTTAASTSDPASIYYSSDYGVNWTQTTTSVGTSNSSFSYVKITASNIAIAGGANSGGIWKSTDGGQTWTRRTLTAQDNLFVDETDSSKMYATNASGTGTLKSVNSGDDWPTINALTFITSLHSLGNKILIGRNAFQGLHFSNDGLTTANNANTSNPTIRSLCSYESNVVASINPNGFAYSTNKGDNWTLVSGTGSTITAQSIAMVGNNVIAPNVNDPTKIYYSSNGGATWEYSLVGMFGNPTFVCMDESNACVCSSATSSTGIWHSSDSGQTWQPSTNTAGGVNMSGTFDSINIRGSVAIACSNMTGIWYSSNSGQSFTQSSLSSLQTYNAKIFGPNAIAGTQSGIYYSTNGGETWTQSSETTNVWEILAVNGEGTIAIAANHFDGSQSGLWYSTSTPLGSTWIQSNITSGTFGQGIMFGKHVLAAQHTGGVYYSSNFGVTYTLTELTNVTTTSMTFNKNADNTTYTFIGGNNILTKTTDIFMEAELSLSIPNKLYRSSPFQITDPTSDSNGSFTYSSSNTNIATISGDTIYIHNIGSTTITATQDACGNYIEGSVTTTFNVFCFNQGTKILTGDNIYLPIECLKEGDLVKTYKRGNRKIAKMHSGKLINNCKCPNECMYKMRKTSSNGLTDDLMVTGGHSILVDSLEDHPSYKKKMMKKMGSVQMIEDKYLLLVGFSKEFERIQTNEVFTFYHFILENDGNDNEQYGVWANGLLTETPSKNQFRMIE